MPRGRVERWEKKLRDVFRKIDRELEKKHGRLYPLHPSRAQHGTTARPESDGLFNIGGVFSPGYGSKHGRGYIVEVRLVTLTRVPKRVKNEVETQVVKRLHALLPKAFPGRELDVRQDGPVYKIVGDLSLD